jgi:plastocyanin
MRQVTAITAGCWLLGAGLAAQGGAVVSGRVSIQEKDRAPTRDLASAVVWLEAAGEDAALLPPRPGTFDVNISDKTYVPRVLVVPRGSTVRFPNRDPFDHNVFFTDSTLVDFGLFGRGQSKSHLFSRTGLVRVFCNVHPRMVAYLVVSGSRHVTQPGPDGAFRLDGVPPGRYTLHVWHERIAAEVTQPVTVPAAGPAGDPLALTLDARGYRWQQHKNKLGQDYTASGRRERY